MPGSADLRTRALRAVNEHELVKPMVVVFGFGFCFVWLVIDAACIRESIHEHRGLTAKP